MGRYFSNSRHLFLIVFSSFFLLDESVACPFLVFFFFVCSTCFSFDGGGGIKYIHSFIQGEILYWGGG